MLGAGPALVLAAIGQRFPFLTLQSGGFPWETWLVPVLSWLLPPREIPGRRGLAEPTEIGRERPMPTRAAERRRNPMAGAGAIIMRRALVVRWDAAIVRP